MKTGPEGIALIKRFEGFRPIAYLDPVGLPTIGYGTLIDNADEQYLFHATITEAEAEILLRTELIGIEKQMANLIRRPIGQYQFDALASFCYNLGVGSLKRSTLLRKLNLNPSDPTIRDEFLKWVRAGGIVLNGLVARRKAEADLYFRVAEMT